MKKDWTNDFFKKENYSKSNEPLMEKSAPRHKSNRPAHQKNNPQAKDILEIMCGNGRISINLAKTGYNVTGIDINKMFIEDAKKKARKTMSKTKQTSSKEM